MQIKFAARFALVSTIAVMGQAGAQQVTGTVGSPSATTTVSNRQLPAPDPRFGGVVKNDALQSKPWWAARVVPPKGAPNVLLVITDDAGFGVPSTFGGVIPRRGPAGLFIRPGHRFQVIDGLLTNFHLPKSSLLVLAAAFAGRERLLAAYAEAIRRHYRFYSFGDAMLIV